MGKKKGEEIKLMTEGRKKRNKKLDDEVEGCKD